MSAKYEAENMVLNEIAYDHNKHSRCPYYGEWITQTDRGACDVILKRATKRSFTFACHFRNVSEKYAEDWCVQYFEKFNMTSRIVDSDEVEKGFFYILVSIPTSEIYKYYKIEEET